MTLNEYQQQAIKTAGSLQPIMLIMGIGGEAGEIIIKRFYFHDHKLDDHHIINELGDLLWYITVLAHALGVKMEDVAQINIDKLKERYPEGFSSERSINRDEK